MSRKLDDFAAEVDSHIKLEVDRLRDEGLSEEDARAAARRTFGNVTAARERFYESHRWLWWDRLSQDVRYAARTLRKAPGFTSIIVLTMVIGIGATTAIFTVTDATLLRPLPYVEPDQLVSVVDDLPGAGAYDVGLSQPEWVDLLRSGIFQYVSPQWFDENNLTGSARPSKVRQATVAPNFFALLGVKPEIGRTFPPDYFGPGYTGEVVISHGLWTHEFGRDPKILDRSIRVDTDLYRIVGVMPAGFHPPGSTTDERNIDVWAAMCFYGPPISSSPPRKIRNIPNAFARLQPGVTIAAAQQQIDALVASLRERYPADYPARSAWAIRLVPLKDAVFGGVRRSLVLLLGAVGLVLLIGCVNVANLLVARSSARGRELSLRQALGAGRARLMRQLLTESWLLSLAGGAAAVVVLFVARGFLIRLVPEGLPQLAGITISWTVLAFALAATVLSGTLFGIAPALHAGRIDLNPALNTDGRRSSTPQTRTRRVLVIAEFALSIVLLAAAGLLLRSFNDLLNSRLGFDPDRVMTVRTRLPYPNDVAIDNYPTIKEEAPFLRDVLRRARALPGVDEAEAGSSSAIPLDHPLRDANVYPFLIEGRGTDPTQAPLVAGSAVTPGYFHVLSMTLLRGRLLTEFDNETAPNVAVVNEAMARAFWPHEDPLGRRVRLTRIAPEWTTVVGIVADARTESLLDAGVPEIFASAYQRPAKHLAIFLRGRFDQAATPDRVRELIQSVDSTLPVFGAQMLSDTVAASVADRRFSMRMVALFALTALLMAALGIYGVISYFVSERTREIAIRVALGAERRTVLRMILGEGLALAFAGVGVGLLCALIVARVMSGLLYGVTPADPVTFIGVAGVLIAVALIACCVPAQRALRIDPLTALRHE